MLAHIGSCCQAGAISISCFILASSRNQPRDFLGPNEWSFSSCRVSPYWDRGTRPFFLQRGVTSLTRYLGSKFFLECHLIDKESGLINPTKHSLPKRIGLLVAMAAPMLLILDFQVSCGKGNPTGCFLIFQGPAQKPKVAIVCLQKQHLSKWIPPFCSLFPVCFTVSSAVCRCFFPRFLMMFDCWISSFQ